MGRHKTSKVVPIDTSEVTPASVVQDTFPAAVPTNPDGTVADKADISLAQIQRIGAVTAESAATNRRAAKVIARKQAGETANWGTDDPLELFDMIMQAFPSSGLYIYITQIHPETITYDPVRADAFRKSADLYAHLRHKIHRVRESAKYEISFKDSSSKQHRGKGHIQMPNTLNDPDVQQGTNMNQPGYPPSPYGYPPQPAPYAQQPYPQPYPQQQYAPPQPYAQPQPYQPVPQAPMPQPQPQAQVQPQQPQMQQPMPPPMPQQPQQQPMQMPTTDPLLLQILQRLDMQQQNSVQQSMQLASALGAVEEFKRLQATQQMYPQSAPQVYTQPPQPAPQQAQTPTQPQPQPPPTWVAPPPWQAPPMPAPMPQQPQALFDQYGRHVGYSQPAPLPQQQQQPQMQQPQMQQQRAGVGAMPIVPPPPPTPQQQATDLVSTFLGMKSQLDTITNALRPVTSGGDDEDDDTPTALAIPHKPPPVTITPLGGGEEPWIMATREDGKIDTLGTVLGNIGQLPKLLHSAAEGIAKMNKQSQLIQHGRPINTVGYPTVEQPVQRALPQAQPQYQPPPQPVQQQQQQMPPPPPPPPSFMPDFSAFAPR